MKSFSNTCRKLPIVLWEIYNEHDIESIKMI